MQALWMLLASAFLASMGVCVKFASAYFHASELVFFRGLISLLMIAAYAAWASGDRSAGPWEKHVIALDLMYNAIDRHLLSSTQWNYTASNRNDPACGDGWNQEDLSVYSVDQGGVRAVEGYVRPYVRACQGVLVSMRFERSTGDFSFIFDADPSIAAPTEVFLPEVHYPGDFKVSGPGLQAETGESNGSIRIWAQAPGRHEVRITRVA